MILVLGFGNPTRRDDGAGWEVIRRLEERNIPGLETRASQQLGLEILEEWDSFERVILVDAAPGPGETTLERVVAQSLTPSASTHHLKPETLLQLSQQLYGRSPELYVCRIPGEDFDFGEGLSLTAKTNVQAALRHIEDWLIS